MMTLLGYHFVLLSGRCFQFWIETQIICRHNIPLRSLMKRPIQAELLLTDWGLHGLIMFYVMPGLEQKQTAVTVICFWWNVFSRSLPTDIEITAFWQISRADGALMAVLEQGHLQLPTLPPRNVPVNKDGVWGQSRPWQGTTAVGWWSTLSAWFIWALLRSAEGKTPQCL